VLRAEENVIMHELALCQSVLNILCEQARIHHFDRVRTVRIEIGALSCVSREAFEFCFAAVTRGTLAEGAALEVIGLPGKAWCLECDEVVAMVERHEACPCCGRHWLRLLQGDEMRIKELEVA
jgi:hydrogenase nickel incorporation protein HypA/HybF